MTRVRVALALVLLSSSAARAATVTLVWGPSPSPEVTGYRVEWGPATGERPNVLDAGLRTTATVPIDTPGRYFFAVRAYSDTATSAATNEVVATIQPPVDTSCDYPLGAKAVSIFVTALQKTGSGGAGSKARLDFQVASPNSPITHVAVRSNGADLSAMNGTDLGAIAGLWFSVPSLPATYALSALATNAYGCTREQSTTYTVTVK